MVRNVSILFLLFITVSCFYNRTEYNRIRFKPSKFSIKPNKNTEVFKIIDTTKLYELVDVIDTINNQRGNSMRKEFLKFYNSGRVGEFESFDINDIESLNPRKAKMAYYNYDKNLVVQFYFEHPQGGD